MSVPPASLPEHNTNLIQAVLLVVSGFLLPLIYCCVYYNKRVQPILRKGSQRKRVYVHIYQQQTLRNGNKYVVVAQFLKEFSILLSVFDLKKAFALVLSYIQSLRSIQIYGLK